MMRQSTKSVASWEAGFRVQAPNSTARDILVVPLDEPSARCTAALAEQPWRNARFVPFALGGGAWRAALAVGRPDLVVIIAQVGENLSQAISLGETCISRGIKISGVLIGDGKADISASLRSLRPWTHTLAVITEADYLPGFLHALGA